VATKVDLGIAISSHRAVSAPTVMAFERLRIAQLLGQIPFQYSLNLYIGDALISRSRSQACTKFLEDTEVPYMLFMDDDIIFNPEDVTKIYESLKTNRYDVIGGIYPVRGASQLSSYGWGGKLLADGKIQNIEYLATGFMGITRKILEKIKDEYKRPENGEKLFICNPNDWSRCWPFFEAKAWRGADRKQGGDPIYISEDWDFCEKVRAVGGRVWADTAVQLGHMREHVYTPKDVTDNQIDSARRAELYGPLDHHSELIKSIDTDLHEFFGITLQAAQDRIKTAIPDLAREYNGGKDLTKSKTVLYDTASLNYHNVYFQERVSPLAGMKGLQILDIGCGMGTAAFILEEQGNDVVGYDIHSKAIEFCNWKKKKYELDGTFTTELPDVSKFDIIVSIGVIQTVKDLDKFLAPLKMITLSMFNILVAPVFLRQWQNQSLISIWA